MPLTETDPAKLKADGCRLADPVMLFIGLMEYTKNEPCLTGCVYLNNGACPAYRKHHSRPQVESRERIGVLGKAHTDQSGLVSGKWLGIPIKKIAEMEGITVGEARRRKARGDYKGSQPLN